MTAYEVKCSQTWAYYKGKIIDYDMKKQEYLVTYTLDNTGEQWKKNEWVSGDSIRELPPIIDHYKWNPKKNEMIECKARAEEHEPFGWWPCQIKNIVSTKNGVRYFVAFDGWGDAHNDVFEKEYIRPRNKHKPLGVRRNIMKYVYEIKDDSVINWFNTSQNGEKFINDLKNLRKKLIHIESKFINKKCIINIIGIKRDVEQVKDVAYLMLERQKNLLSFERKAQLKEQELQKKKEKEASAKKATFKVHPLLTGLLLGKNMSKFQRVKERIPEVVNCYFDKGECVVLASSQDSLNEAVDQLQVIAKKVQMHQSEMGRIIGDQGSNLQDLKERNGLVNILSWKKWESTEFEKQITICKSRLKNKQQNKNNNNNNNNNDENIDFKYDINYFDKLTPNDLFIEQNDAIYDLRSNKNEILIKEYLKNKKNEQSNKLINDNNGIVNDIGINNNNNNDDDIKNNDDGSNNNNVGSGKNRRRRKRKPVNAKKNEEDNSNNISSIDHIDEEIDYSNIQGWDEDDALILIGRKSRVDLCISMIELNLEHLRRLSAQKEKVVNLKKKINEIKGRPNDYLGNFYTDNNGNYSRNNNFGGRRGRGRGRGRGGRGSRGRGRGRGNNRGNRGRGNRRYNNYNNNNQYYNDNNINNNQNNEEYYENEQYYDENEEEYYDENNEQYNENEEYYDENGNYYNENNEYYNKNQSNRDQYQPKKRPNKQQSNKNDNYNNENQNKPDNNKFQKKNNNKKQYNRKRRPDNHQNNAPTQVN